MRICDEVLEDLRNGMPFEELVKKYHGKSAIYSALRDYYAETDEILDKRHREMEETSTKLGRLNSEETSLRRRVELDNANQERIRSSCQKLAAEEQQKKTTIEQLEVRSAKLKSEGYSPEIMQRLLACDAKSPLKLLERVATIKEHETRKSELAEIQKKMALLENEVAIAQARKQQIEKSIITQRNTLDEYRIRNTTYEDAVAVATSLLQQGYSLEDLESLKSGLSTVAIANAHKLSIKRLVDSLRKLKTLMQIDEKITEKRSERAELEKAAVEAKAKLSVAGEESLKSIVDAGEAAKKTIGELSNQAKERMKDSTERFDDNLANSVAKANGNLRLLAENLRKNLDEWSELEEKIARTKEYILPGQMLLGILTSTEDLNKVDLELVARLFERLNMWFELHLKDATARPTEGINRDRFNLPTLRSYRLSSLVEFLSESLRQMSISEQKKSMEKKG
jgi:hypothetical protein